MATTLRGNRYRTSRQSRAAFARAARQAEEWQRRNPPRSLDDALFRRTCERGQNEEQGPATGTIAHDTAMRMLAASVVKQAIEQWDWHWLESQESYLYAALLGMDDEVWQTRVKRARARG